MSPVVRTGLYDPTGDITFECLSGDTIFQFRLHAANIIEYRSFLTEVFHIPQPRVDGGDEPPRVVRLHDDLKALEVFFVFLLNPRENPLRLLDTPRVENILELADKYDCQSVVDTVLVWLQRGWPITLVDWDHWVDEAAETRGAPSLEDSHTPSLITAAVAIKLGRTYDFPSIIPYAFYAINAQCGGITEGTALQALVVESFLTENDVKRIGDFRAWIVSIFDGIDNPYKYPELGWCGSPHCASHESLVHDCVKAGLPLVGIYDPLHLVRMVYDLHWPDSPVKTLCPVCVARSKKWADGMRTKIWEHIPKHFVG